MTKVGNLLLLLIYVLGAHVLPLAHIHTHHVDHHHTVQAKNAKNSCCGHTHCHRISTKAGLQANKLAASKLAGGQLVFSDAPDSHRCGPTCAICIAGKAPCGFIATASLAMVECLPSFGKLIESSRLLSGVIGGLPGPRGPPLSSVSKSISA